MKSARLYGGRARILVAFILAKEQMREIESRKMCHSEDKNRCALRPTPGMDDATLTRKERMRIVV
jgi:hypothetical protein